NKYTKTWSDKMSTLTAHKPNVAIKLVDNLPKSSYKTSNKIYETTNLNLWYGETHAIKGIDLPIYENEVVAIIGPSGCGKSTYLKTLNRMVELVPEVKVTGKVTYNGKSIFDNSYDVEELRSNVGMVFQKPNPFPKSIYENIAYGPKIHGIRNKAQLDEIVEQSLKKAYIWDEVKDR